MAKNDRHNRQGKLAELEVAKAFVESGCTLNFLSFMDVGLDLHVQMPQGLQIPAPEAGPWEMSGRTVHVQVKSTTGDRLPPISVETARSWAMGARTGVPTLLIGVAVGADRAKRYRFFDPLLVDFKAHRACGETFTVRMDDGEAVAANDIDDNGVGAVSTPAKKFFQAAAHWLEKGPSRLSHAIDRPWGANDHEVWGAAATMIADLTAMFQRQFHRADEVLEGRNFAEPARTLAQAFLRGAFIDYAAADDFYASREQTFEIEVAETLHGVISSKHGWSEHVEPLALVTPETSESGALSDLEEICSAYGRVVRGRLRSEN